MFSNPGIRYGLFGGASVVIFFMVVFTARPELFHHLGLQYGSLAIYLLFMYLASKADVDAHGAAREFRELIRTPFVTFLVINLCYWVFYYALHLFDPELVIRELNMELAGIKAQLEGGVGDPQQANVFRERITAIEKALLQPPTQPLGPIVTRMFIGALGGFGLAAGVVTITRNQK